MLELGADPNAADSFGNSGLWRFCLQARQILPGYNHSTHTILSDRLLTEELTQDLTRIIRHFKRDPSDDQEQFSRYHPVK